MPTYNETKSDMLLWVPSRVQVLELLLNPPNNVFTWWNGNVGQYSSVQQYNTPGWRKLIKNGSTVMSPVEICRTSRSVEPGYLLYHYPQQGKSAMYSGDFPSFVRGEATAPSNEARVEELALVQDLAITAAMARVNSGDMLSGEFFRDLKETIQMLKSPFDAAVRHVERMTKYRLRYTKKSGLNLVEANEKTWLEFRYGWKPLMMDIESICNNIVRKHNVGKRRLVVRGGASRDFLSTQSVSCRLRGDFNHLAVEGSYSREINIRGSAGVIVEIEATSIIESLMQAFGLRLRDVPVTLWAITPFSFVIDWFANVEQWLQAIVPDARFNIVSNWVTTVTTGTVCFHGESLTGDPPIPSLGKALGSPGSDEFKRLIVLRTVNRNVPNTPLLLRKSLSVTNSIDAAALSCLQIGDAVRRFAH